jgi:hypothetical protein
MTRPPKALSAYLADIGAKGGKAKGKTKVRGDAAYYARIQAKSAKKKAANRAAAEKAKELKK